MRVATALLAVVALTAFAPAPFPKKSRQPLEDINLEKFQGTWKSLGLDGINQGKRSNIAWGITAVRVQGSLWTYLNQGNTENAKYRIVIDGTKRPATIDFYSGEQEINLADGRKPYMLGLIRRQGNRVEILFYTVPPENRAKSFENPPDNWWILTLEKQQ